MTDADTCANRVYYLDVAPGRWRGDFGFEVTDWRAFLADDLPLRYRLLVVSMALLLGLLGRATITSTVESYPERGRAGVATNEIRIAKAGLPLYLLRETYHLDPNCTDVTVRSAERFGPVPGVLSTDKRYPAEISADGTHATYRMPLLGTDWVGEYDVRADRDHVEADLTCEWATATEVIERVG